MRKKLKTVPWGVLSWIFGIFVFYLTAGIWGVQFVFAQVMAQTSQIATIFDSWWQILMFVLDIIVGVLFLVSLCAFIWVKFSSREEKKSEKLET